MQVDERYMRRCLTLAKAGVCNVAPNPMVGAVIVYQNRIIGEGFHQRCGELHAEVNAINAVKDRRMLKDATLYVNLEPCSHYGRTPPCVELIIRESIPRVVVGCLDPYPEVSGRGVRMLQAAGIEVVVDVMKEESMRLNHFFMTAQTQQRPYVILKWAQSIDGYIDHIRTNNLTLPVQFSTPETRRYLHKLRSEVSAIMVGTNTAVLDNPSLTVRHWTGNSPVRVVLDRTLRVPASHHLFDGTVRTLVFTEERKENRKNVEYVRVDFSDQLIPAVLRFLFEQQLNSLLVEGGALLHGHFLTSGLVDEVRVETSPMQLNDGVLAPDIQSVKCKNKKSVLFENTNNTITVCTC